MNKIIDTADGSPTLYRTDIDEHYHSTFGARQESEHVFINTGLRATTSERLTIFEVGFGTGLNALLAQQEAERTHREIEYIAIEKYPLEPDIWQALDYGSSSGNIFELMHKAAFHQPVRISPFFSLFKIENDLLLCDLQQLPKFDIVFFDAFSPDKQPELWSAEIFKSIFEHCNPGALLVTYCAKGYVRRNMLAAGFVTERLPGPPGKREMLRATRPAHSFE